MAKTRKRKPDTEDDFTGNSNQWLTDHQFVDENDTLIMAKKDKPDTSKKTGRPPKYTIEWCMQEVKGMLDFLNTPSTDENAEKQRRSILFIEELCLRGGYAPQRWSSWKKVYANVPEFMELVYMVEATLRIRLLKSSVAGQTNAFVSVHLMKAIYGMVENTPGITDPSAFGMKFTELFFLKYQRLPTEEELRQLGLMSAPQLLAGQKTPEDRFTEIQQADEENGDGDK